MSSIDLQQNLIAKLKLKHLDLLLAVNEYRSIFHAAKALKMAQPAASKIIHDLEDLLDVSLFERTSRGVIPTLYGDIAIKQANLILSQVKNTSEELISLKEGVSGQVRIGTLLAASSTLLPKAVAALKIKRPNVSIFINEGTFDELIEGLKIGDLDMVLSRLPTVFAEGELETEPLYEEEVVIVARAEHPCAKQKNLSLSDLAGESWILPPTGTLLRQDVEEAFFSAGLGVPTNSIESIIIQCNLSVLINSNTIGLIPSQILKLCPEFEGLVKLPVSLNATPRSVGIILNTSRELAPAAVYLKSLLRETAKTHFQNS